MSSFTTPLDVRQQDGKPWMVLSPFEYHVGSEDSGVTIRIPAGFETDFASIPRVWRWRFDPSGRVGKAAVVHDFLYFTGDVPEIPGRGCQDPRKRADLILLEAMGVLEMSWWDKHVIYWAVRAGGWLPWRCHRKQQEGRIRIHA